MSAVRPLPLDCFGPLDAMADRVHALAQKKGWYASSTTEGEFLAKAVNNLHSEASELWEAYLNGQLRQPCDRADQMAAAGLPSLTCLEEKLADLIIRALDDARHLGVDIGRAVAVKHCFDATRPIRHGGKLA